MYLISVRKYESSAMARTCDTPSQVHAGGHSHKNITAVLEQCYRVPRMTKFGSSTVPEAVAAGSARGKYFR